MDETECFIPRWELGLFIGATSHHHLQPLVGPGDPASLLFSSFIFQFSFGFSLSNEHMQSSGDPDLM